MAVYVVFQAESNESLSYTIVPGDQGRNNNPTKYGIDEEGKITLLEALDREETESFELSIKVGRRGQGKQGNDIYKQTMDVSGQAAYFCNSLCKNHMEC